MSEETRRAGIQLGQTIMSTPLMIAFVAVACAPLGYIAGAVLPFAAVGCGLAAAHKRAAGDKKETDDLGIAAAQFGAYTIASVTVAYLGKMDYLSASMAVGAATGGSLALVSSARCCSVAHDHLCRAQNAESLQAKPPPQP